MSVDTGEIRCTFRYVIYRWISTGVLFSVAWQSGTPVSADLTRVAKSNVPRYRQQWAVIVGINYQHLSGAEAAEVPRLGTAEGDAQAVYDRLVKNYGYSPKCVRLLLGAAASRENIEKCFGNEFLGDSQIVGEEDCVLIYFAGHGNRREAIERAEEYIGLVYPADIRVIAGKGVDIISCLRIDQVVGWLNDYCAARHKLLLLDSCHSGEVFKFGTHRSAGVNRGFRPNLFREHAFQAIAAAAGSQAAADSDATGKHSPFAACFLEALDQGPYSQERRLFSVSELFAFIPDRLSQLKGVQQDSRGGWLHGEGDFYFFPVTGVPASDSVDELQKEMLVPAVSEGPQDVKVHSTYWLLGVLSTMTIGIGTWLTLRRRKFSKSEASLAFTLPAGSSTESETSQHGADVLKIAAPAAIAPCPKLSLFIQGTPLEVYCQFAEQVELGRSPECGFPLLMAPSQVSKRHARLSYCSHADAFFLEDLNTNNGTAVDGKKVTSRVKMPAFASVTLANRVTLAFRHEWSADSSRATLSGSDESGAVFAKYVLVPRNEISLKDVVSHLPGITAEESAMAGRLRRKHEQLELVNHDESCQRLFTGLKLQLGAIEIAVRVESK